MAVEGAIAVDQKGVTAVQKTAVVVQEVAAAAVQSLARVKAVVPADDVKAAAAAQTAAQIKAVAVALAQAVVVAAVVASVCVRGARNWGTVKAILTLMRLLWVCSGEVCGAEVWSKVKGCAGQ